MQIHVLKCQILVSFFFFLFFLNQTKCEWMNSRWGFSMERWPVVWWSLMHFRIVFIKLIDWIIREAKYSWGNRFKFYPRIILVRAVFCKMFENWNFSKKKTKFLVTVIKFLFFLNKKFKKVDSHCWWQREDIFICAGIDILFTQVGYTFRWERARGYITDETCRARNAILSRSEVNPYNFFLIRL